MNWASVLVPIATLILGQILGMVTESYRDKRQRTKEIERRQADRSEAAMDRRDSFELQVLTDVRPALIEFVRPYFLGTMGRIRTHAAEGGEFRATLTERALDAEQLEKNRKLSALASLILDEDLRNLVEKARTAVLNADQVPVTPRQAEEAHNASSILVGQALSATARRIRELYGKGA